MDILILLILIILSLCLFLFIAHDDKEVKQEVTDSKMINPKQEKGKRVKGNKIVLCYNKKKRYGFNNNNNHKN